MKIKEFHKIINDIVKGLPENTDKDITVIVNSSSIGSTPSVGIESVSMGFDLDGGQVMIKTTEPVIKKVKK